MKEGQCSHPQQMNDGLNHSMQVQSDHSTATSCAAQQRPRISDKFPRCVVHANVGQKLLKRNILRVFKSFLLSKNQDPHATFSQYEAI